MLEEIGILNEMKQRKEKKRLREMINYPYEIILYLLDKDVMAILTFYNLFFSHFSIVPNTNFKFGSKGL